MVLLPVPPDVPRPLGCILRGLEPWQAQLKTKEARPAPWLWGGKTSRWNLENGPEQSWGAAGLRAPRRTGRGQPAVAGLVWPTGASFGEDSVPSCLDGSH